MAYAAVNSLKHTIQRLKNSISKPQITKSAYEELTSLGSMLKELDYESSRSIDRKVINEVDAKIRDAVYKVEDVLESYYSLIPPSQDLDEKGVEEEMNSFLKKVKILREEYDRALLHNPLPAEEEDEALYAAVLEPVNKSTTVGLSDLSDKIINQLLDVKFGRVFLSLFGMAGIGKSHLAIDIYHHRLIVEHFHLRVWVNLGPKDRKIEKVLMDIGAQMECKPRYLFKEKSKNELTNIIRKHLNTQRYLIVLDDIWSSQVLRGVFDLFSSDVSGGYVYGSRVLVTTRLHKVASYQRGLHIEMRFLNNEESWNLLWQNVFVDVNTFLPQLEKPGRKIAENCEGLPLLILTVADILRRLDKTREYWEKVAENKTTTFTEACDQIYETLLPSYEYLPQHLKPCFLYMGVFPRTSEIRSSKLINLWDVEDFPLEPSCLKNWEESSIESMEDLVWNSVAFIRKQSFESARRIKSLKIHSVYWYLCVKEAKKINFFYALNKLTDVDLERPRRLAVQNKVLLGLKAVYDSMAAATSTTRSLLCTGVDHQYPVQICFSMLLLLKVLDALAIRFYEFPEEVVKLLQLRYLSLTQNGELPSSFSKLQQLQYLILRRHHNIIKLVERDSSCLPDEIWDLQELRHVRIKGSNLPDPSEGAELPKLSTLYVNANSCTKAVFKGIPNLKKLGITIELQPDAAETIRCLEHISILKELESLKCVVVNPRLRSQSVVSLTVDLTNWRCWHLKKMSLEGLGLSWNNMSAVGSLCYLEVLKLRCSAFQGPEWNTKAGQFQILKYLLLEDLDLVHWTAGEKYFPRLNHLSVRHCYKLKEIPCQIGIADNTIKKLLLEVDDCSPSVVDSVEKIKLKATYSELQFEVNSSWNFR